MKPGAYSCARHRLKFWPNEYSGRQRRFWCAVKKADMKKSAFYSGSCRHWRTLLGQATPRQLNLRQLPDSDALLFWRKPFSRLPDSDASPKESGIQNSTARMESKRRRQNPVDVSNQAKVVCAAASKSGSWCAGRRQAQRIITTLPQCANVIVLCCIWRFRAF